MPVECVHQPACMVSGNQPSCARRGPHHHSLVRGDLRQAAVLGYKTPMIALTGSQKIISPNQSSELAHNALGQREIPLGIKLRWRSSLAVTQDRLTGLQPELAPNLRRPQMVQLVRRPTMFLSPGCGLRFQFLRPFVGGNVFAGLSHRLRHAKSNFTAALTARR